ncbi:MULTISPECIES: FAD-dependent oxidoreductase [Micrococcaceae]|uniref:FAD-dependent oxidoreductase n=1 Tax=Micrococcaceae TaxID=1268 RepID=UPI00160DBA5C|nr:MULTISPECIES: FAD-dependent oxidoreductase [Micrococcaceae]MBB5750099.1 succinate dehydrogenase/fumarate reductase flavoprotein subunit [Micrococcus sp. TA1]HRO95031.1 FAD-dependent oxidoreductase [Citricoccus sp.]
MTPETTTPQDSAAPRPLNEDEVLANGVPVEDVDVLVAGSGAGGLSAAVTAAYHGLNVMVAEKASVCGGATSWSGGWAWTPGTALARAEGVNEDREQFRTYLRGVLGERYTPAAAEKIDAFLEAVPHMVGFFHTKTAMQFVTGAKINDIYGHLPGAGTGNRSVGPKPVNAYEFRPELLKKMRRQYYPTSFFGMGIMAGKDLTTMLSASQWSPKGWAYAAGRVIPHVWDMVRKGRSMHLVNGTALTGRLMKSADDLGVDIRVNAPVQQLVRNTEGRVTGALVGGPDGGRYVRASRGVVLATGGFPHDVERRRQLFPKAPTGNEHWSLAPEEAAGDGLDLALGAGGVFDTDMRSPAAWCPVSLVPFPNGSQGAFPHIMDRAKPGSIGVRRDGRRFVNEANGYFDYVDGLLQATPDGEPVESWQIADSTFVRKYPLGFAKPIPMPLLPYIKAGYLIKADTLEELAGKCGIDPTGLVETVREFNENARRGEDPQFQRGATPFNRYGGDPKVGPNPSLAPIKKGPFYAVHVRPGSFGTFAGIAADTRARVVDTAGRPVPGLYTAGNDHASIMRGNYPSGGINLGPAMAFGYIAGRDLAGVTEYEDDGTQAPTCPDRVQEHTY